jgi:Ni,Fe-hydrogenase III small subunit/formate hydrogenlyase subunit 6/NADH:ubiquinone oxidoreductase subunit I
MNPMLEIIKTRLSQGHRTTKFPDAPLTMPERYRGRPALDASKCPEGCAECVGACPTNAITAVDGLAIDLGKCLFCTACVEACPHDAIAYTQDFRLATSARDHLVLRGNELQRAERMRDELFRVLGRALRLREVCAGSCNACDLDTNVLNTVGWDLSRFGIQLVASPRHADGLIVTGPVTRNMRHALMETYEAIPKPKIVIAVGACAISGGPFVGQSECHDGVSALLPVDLFIPGCPPHPATILDGLLRLLGRIHD